MSYVLALDLSLSSSGICVFNEDGSIYKLLTIETNAKAETKYRLNTIAKEMKKIKKEFKPKIVIIESGFSRYNISTQTLFKVHGVANYIFYDCEQIYIYATSVRKTIVGKGNAKKEEIRDFILNKYKNLSFKNMDETDSVATGLAYFINKGILKNEK